MLDHFSLPQDVELKLKGAEFFKQSMRKLEKGCSPETFHYQSFYFEAALFSLVGAKDAFLVYLNSLSKFSVRDHKVSERNLKEHFEKNNDVDLLKAVGQIIDLRADKTSWLAKLISYRNIATHRQFISGSVPIKTTLLNMRVFLNKLIDELPADNVRRGPS